MQKIHKKSKNRVKAYSILPGIDKNVYNISKKLCIKKTKTTYVYAGSLNKIRGFDLLMDSFKNIKEPGITLKILARGATDRQVNEIRRKILHSSIEIQIVGGWLDKQKFAESISTADITLLPFLLVPSELPVTVMESIELGTPVLVSDIAGLSEAAGPAGILIEPGSLSSLREAIIKIHRDRDLKNRLKEKCLIQREKYLQWDQISQNWLDLLESVR
jgi:glycosyltransferase involved in cell wall biosynthesis